MDGSRLETLNKKRTSLHEDYRLVAIEKIEADDEYNKRLAAISGSIHEVDMEIRMLRMPVEEVN